MDIEKFKQISNELANFFQNPRLLAVTKYSNIDEINFAIKNWVNLIWENRVESAQEKFPNLIWKVEKHFIWVVQTNKLRKIIELFDVIESISSIKQLKKVNSISKELNVITKVFLQFNISSEVQKSWFIEENVLNLIQLINDLKNISIIWIMWIWSNSILEENKKEFKFAKKIFDVFKHDIPSIIELSIWMSNDYKIALEEWSTIVRIGSLLFK